MFGLVPFGSKKNNEVARREDGFHSLFDIFNEPFFTNPFAGFGDMGMPASMRVDVKDNGSSYELTADLPGMEKKDISLSYDNNYLVYYVDETGMKRSKPVEIGLKANGLIEIVSGVEEGEMVIQ